MSEGTSGIDFSKVQGTEEITELTGIPIDEEHVFLLSDSEGDWVLNRWARAFRRDGVPHVVLEVDTSTWVIFKHMWSGGKDDPSRGYCCGANR